jgi:aryl-alcohol dehydrogenase-like predicted oxidoreductase
MSNTMKRILGKSGIEVSAMGLGCWAIGGHFELFGKADGWGAVDDNESIQAIRKAIDLGITFFDTADVYGAGHSEEVLGKALKGIRDKVVIASKFGYTFDPIAKKAEGLKYDPEYIKNACHESLRRLGTDYIDLYLLHIGDLAKEEAGGVMETLEELKNEGLIRSYGWSADDCDRAAAYAGRANFTAVEYDFNIFLNADELIKVCEENNLASIIRSPLAMGLLSGKFTETSKLPADDVRGAGHDWVRYFKDAKPKEEFLKKLDCVKEILQSGGRSLVQGALSYIWGKSETMIPIPGFKCICQVEENAKAMEFGAFSRDIVEEIECLLTGEEE